MSRSEDLATDIVSDAAAAPASPRAPRRLVLFWDGGSAAHEIPERGSLTIGRASTCAIVVDHRSVSRVHAVLHAGPSLVLEDMGSANGTWVDGARLASGERAALASGAVGVVGTVSFVVAAAAPAHAPATGESAIRRLDTLAELVASSDISVIIQGETGAGKEVLAERIHRGSKRANGAFVRLNCAALPETLIESELFGHERGAFTGATQTKVGLVEAAQGGTLFLDEIGEMSLATQAKLLRAIESREVTRLGAVKPRPIDVRFLAATHRDLLAASESGGFRRDLYFRLNGISLTVPPLRERVPEIAGLARTFADGAWRRSGQPVAGISERALAALQGHRWPGNVRELKNVVERAVLLARGGEIQLEHVDLGAPPAPAAAARTGAGALPAELASVERTRILEALEKSSGNQKEAAKLLGISRRTLLYRLDMYDLPRPRKRV